MKPQAIRRRPVLGPLALLACAVSARAEVWVVDPDTLPISFVLLMAADGDTLLVRDGTYYRFTISGKSLRVIADGDDVFVDGSNPTGPGSYSIGVGGLGPEQEVLVRGFRTNYGVSVGNCEGPVWIDDVVGTGGGGICALGSAPGIRVGDSDAVTFTRCAFVGEVGGNNVFTAPVASAGAEVTSAKVQLYDCVLVGGDGSSNGGLWPEPQPGAAGLKLDASTVTLVGCSIQGGGGGLDTGGVCGGSHAPGGPGIEFVGGASTIRAVESTALGGVVSLEPMCPGQTGPQGPPVVGTGTVVPMAGVARHLAANGPVRGGGNLTFQLEGVADETPLLLVSPVHEPVPLVAWSGVLLVGLPPADLFVLDPLPSSGRASLSFPVPPLAPGVEVAALYVQSVFLDPTPRVWLGPGTTVVLLDATL